MLQVDYVLERDAHEISLSDTLDVKASIILAAIVFLAGQSEGFFHAGLGGGWPHALQYFSVAADVLGAVFAVVELYPRDFSVEGSPRKYDDWISSLREHYAARRPSQDIEALVAEQVIVGRRERASERVERNIRLNKQKSNCLFASFVFTVAAFSANILMIAMRLF